MPDWLTDLSADFFNAEEAVKRIEDDIRKAIVPSINELRYFGNHVCRASTTDIAARRDEEILRARRHLARARYDAYETGVIFMLESIAQFKDRHHESGESLLSVISDWPQLLAEVEQQKESANRTSKRIRERRPDEFDPFETVSGAEVIDDIKFASETEQFYVKLRVLYQRFERAEPQIIQLREEKLRDQQISARRWLIGILISLAAVLVALAKILTDAIFKVIELFFT